MLVGQAQGSESNAQNPHKKLANGDVGEGETDRCWSASLAYSVSVKPMRDPVSKEVEMAFLRMPLEVVLWAGCVCNLTHTCTNMEREREREEKEKEKKQRG